MYAPAAFRETRLEVLHAVIREHSFGTLVAVGDGGLEASHIPFLLDAERGSSGTLLGHVARGNPQWHAFSRGAQALAIFQGPHGYVSPGWYEQHPSVPTWNYVAVHAYGVPRLIQDEASLEHLVRAMVERYESVAGTGWRMDLPADYQAGMLRGIVGFEMPIARIEGTLKLSQNRSVADRRQVVRGLLARATPTSGVLANAMCVHALSD